MKLDSQSHSEIFLEKKSNPVFLARKALGISQAEMAAKLELTKNYVWMLETGKKPITPQMAEKVKSLTKQSNLSETPGARIVDESDPPEYAARLETLERFVVKKLGAMELEISRVISKLDYLADARKKKDLKAEHEIPNVKKGTRHG